MIKFMARGARRAEILIHQTIGADFFGDGLTSKKFAEDLAELGDVGDILIRINSPGGAVFDGVAIYNALKAHKAHKHVQVEGLAASIASVIAMAGDKITMLAGSQMMIHGPWTVAVGDANEMRGVAATLDQVGASMSEIYAARSGQAIAAVRELMDAETWFDGAGAVDKGFADEYASAEPEKVAASAEQHRAEFKRFAATMREQISQLSPLQIAAAVRHIEEQQMRIAAHATPPAQSSAADILAAERTRRSDIRARFGRYSDPHRALLDECLDDPATTPQAAADRLLSALGRDIVPAGPGAHDRRPVPEGDFMAAAVDALVMRAGLRIEQPHPAARDFANVGVMDLARMCLSQRGTSRVGFSTSQVLRAALTTSDFPLILENTLGKMLRNGYETDPQSHRAWVHVTQVKDFKTVSRLLLGSMPNLMPVNEYASYPEDGGPPEDKATLAVSKFGRMLAISWETLINDDLQAFASIPQGLGAAARRKEADDVYALFALNSAGGPTMQDSVALFHSSHGNLSTVVGAISTSTLGAARALLRKQQALGGGYMNLNPRYLIVPAESETLAEQVMAQATRHVSDTTATNQRRMDATTPEWISQLQLVVEPRLADANGFYVAAHWNQVDTLELATLEADAGAPVIEQEPQFTADVVRHKVRHVFVPKFIDWRGIVRVPKT